MRHVKPTWRAAVFVCTNERAPETGRVSCGQKRGIELCDWLKHRVKALGLKEDVLCAKSGCLGICSPLGTTVSFHPEPGTGEPSMLVFEHDSDDREALWVELQRRLALKVG